MREIKFRAWKNNKRIADIRVMYIDEKGLVAVNPDIADCVEQFTGLRDKNDREIYEGDICIHPNGHVAPVAWSDGLLAWNFSINEYVCDQEAGGVGNGEVEVVGNIHENPELLA